MIIIQTMKKKGQSYLIVIIILVAVIGFVWASSSGYIKLPNNFFGNSCEEKLPKYFLSSDLTDGFGQSLIREGINKGENVNYYYLKSGEIIYSENVINEEGVMLGTTKIVYSPVLKLINISWKEELEKNYSVEGLDITGEQIIYKLSWENFNDEIKKILNKNELTIEVFKDTYYTINLEKKTFCNDTISSENGEYSCPIDSAVFDTTPTMSIKFLGRIAKVDLGKELNVKITPDIFRKKLYEVIDYRISECKIID